MQLPAPGAPETLLLVGSDHRAGEPYQVANTDTMMLVRIDDSSQTINVMSIPRDLAVMLPGAAALREEAQRRLLGGGLKLLAQDAQAGGLPRPPR